MFLKKPFLLSLDDVVLELADDGVFGVKDAVLSSDKLRVLTFRGRPGLDEVGVLPDGSLVGDDLSRGTRFSLFGVLDDIELVVEEEVAPI
jgi:hypothetical protein